MFFYQLKNELWKLFGKKRTYIGFGMLMFGQLLMIVLLRYNSPRWILRSMERTGFSSEDYISMLTIATSEVLAFGALIMPLYVALVGGDLVSKEAEDGTLRMILARPISRMRLLVIKWLSGLLFCGVLIGCLGAFALVFSAIWFPVKGGMFAFIPDELLAVYGFSDGMFHYVLTIIFMVTKACSIMSLAFMFSCFNMKPAAATILTLSLTIMDYVLMKIPAFVDIQHWFLSYYFDAWHLVLETPVPWWKVGESVFVMIGVSLTFLVVGVTVFQMRDIKS